MARIIPVDPANPPEEVIAQAARIMEEGEVVVFPTTGLYGLGADALNPYAIARIFQVKGRPERKPLLVLVNSLDQVEPLVREIPPDGQILMEKLWPGGITLVFWASGLVPPSLCGGTGKIGIRMAAHPVARALVAEFGRPITGTSANLSGDPGVSNFPEMSRDVLERVSMVLDAGKLAGGTGSTVVDMTAKPPVVLRQGAVSEEAIARALSSNQSHNLNDF
ncbi:MAG: threonylcarbamoyl-AMP synthase [Desulfatibacillum sp.]|nr:threonylcarbamoyl-AMP synthase [Desulfatibacillum sp.]